VKRPIFGGAGWPKSGLSGRYSLKTFFHRQNRTIGAAGSEYTLVPFILFHGQEKKNEKK
jgi:hypothetical protein